MFEIARFTDGLQEQAVSIVGDDYITPRVGHVDPILVVDSDTTGATQLPFATPTYWKDASTNQIKDVNHPRAGVRHG